MRVGMVRMVRMVGMMRMVAVGVRVVRMMRMVAVSVRMVRMVRVMRMVAVAWKVAVRPPATARYARRGAVGIPTATLTQARAACAAVCHLTCRCDQQVKNEKEGAAAVKHKRAHSPDPQARGPLSQWTEV